MQPNIVFILMDDLGWRDLGCYGSSFYETPNLDRLCAEGMRFTNAYAACPVCSPTRASFLTGKYPARVGVTDYIGGANRGKLIDAPYVRQLPLEEKTVATALREAGYRAWHVGKWHLGERAYYPDRHGFDVNIGGCAWGHPRNGYFSPYGIETLGDGPDGEYLTDRLTDEAINLIRRHRDGSPFFLNLCHYAVHTPIQAPAALVEKYRKKRLALGLDKMRETEECEFFPTEAKRQQRVTRRLVQSSPEYAAMMENLDTNIGRLLDALKDSGREENTAVFFYSDNGGLATAEGSPTSNAPLSNGKGWMYDGGVREPLLVRWPGTVRPGAVCDTPVTTPDFFPTFAQLAGVAPDRRVDGVSLLPLLTGGGIAERPIFWHYPHYGNQGGTPAAAVRLGDWKLIHFFERDAAELYNLRDDLGEERDLSGAQPQRVAALRALLEQWFTDVGAKFPTPNPDWA